MSAPISRSWWIPLLLFGSSTAAPLDSAGRHLPKVPVEEFRIHNGMTFLLLQRPASPSVAAGWVAGVGSADDKHGRTGASHLIEHLMFKGSHIVGARNLDQELALLAEEDRIREELDRIEDKLSDLRVGRRKQGKLTDQKDELGRALLSLRKQARETTALGEFSLLYAEHGASGLNANALRDLTLYYVTLPAEKLELWFWLESDRLLQPVFREFAKEVRVVKEERRMRVDSTPTGRQDEELRQRFWGDHPYRWPTLGLPADLDSLRRPDVTHFFQTHYQPSNLTAALVGQFDPERVKQLAELYFGRLQTQIEPVPATPISTKKTRSHEPLEVSCNCPSQAQVFYPTVAFGHPDSYALDVLAGLMNGRTGRLFRTMVLGREIAFAAFVSHSPLKQAGYFSFTGESKGNTTPQQLVEAWKQELQRLLAQPIPADELERVKNRVTGDAFRRLKDPVSLLQQLLIYDGLGDWRHVNKWPQQVLQVESGQIQAVARRYLTGVSPVVGLYYRRQGAVSAPLSETGSLVDPGGP